MIINLQPKESKTPTRSISYTLLNCEELSQQKNVYHRIFPSLYNDKIQTDNKKSLDINKTCPKHKQTSLKSAVFPNN